MPKGQTSTVLRGLQPYFEANCPGSAPKCCDAYARAAAAVLNVSSCSVDVTNG